MTSLRSQAELYYNRPSTASPAGGNYSYRVDANNNLCSSQAIIDGITAALNVVNAPPYNPANRLDAATNDLADAANRDAQCASNSSEYRIVVPLAQDGGFWCVDSQGTARQYATNSVPPAISNELTDTIPCP
jgi:hypothetical protein